MKRNLLLLAEIVLAVLVSAVAFAACNPESNLNGNANVNGNSNTRVSETSPTATPTPKYTEEQAREERERAKSNKETIGESLEDAWLHTKIVAQLIGNSATPERKINVDVVNGEVTLRGTVDTAEAKTEAERVAKQTDGVKKVTNQLKVVAAKSASTPKTK